MVSFEKRLLRVALATISNSKLGTSSKTENRRLSWLIVAVVVAALCDVANPPDALACGAPGQFGGCLAHGQFDSTINKRVASPDSRFHETPIEMEALTGTTRSRGRERQGASPRPQGYVFRAQGADDQDLLAFSALRPLWGNGKREWKAARRPVEPGCGALASRAV
jgi:hypothetical protein